MKLPYSKVVLGLAGLSLMTFTPSSAKADTLELTPSFFNYTSGLSASVTNAADSESTFITVGSHNLVVTELGAYVGSHNDNPGDSHFDQTTLTNGELADSSGNTDQPFTVTVFDITKGTTLTYAIIPTGTAISQQTGTGGASPAGFAYVAVTPLTLTAGDTYALQNDGGDPNVSTPGYYYSSTGYGVVATPYARTYGSGTGPLETGAGLTISGDGPNGNNYGSTTEVPGNAQPGINSAVAGTIVYTVTPEPSALAYLVVGGVVLFFGLRRKMAKNS